MIDLDVIRSALSNMVISAIEFAPILLTALVILLIGWLIARVISKVIERVAEQVGLEKVFDRTGVSAGLQQAQIQKNGTEITSLLIFWMIFLNFLLVGLDYMGLEAAIEPLRSLIDFFPRILIAMITLVAGIMLSQFLGRASQATMRGMGIEFHEEIGQGVNILLVIIVMVVVLEQLGMDAQILITIFTSVITITVAGLALAFGLGGRDVARNVLAGYYAREQFEPGDLIVISGEEGFLEGIGTLNSEIRVGEDILIVPNTRLTATAVKIREIADSNDASLEESGK